MREFETKVLDIDVDSVRNTLAKLNAKEFPEVLLKRWVFIIAENEWIRLRTDGSKTTLTFKKKIGSGVSETEEIEATVSDFRETAAIFSRLSFKESYYQENKRIVYTLDDSQFMIDTWPGIPSYLEVEANSEENVIKGLQMLHLSGLDVGNLSVKDVYVRYGKNLHHSKELKF